MEESKNLMEESSGLGQHRPSLRRVSIEFMVIKENFCQDMKFDDFEIVEELGRGSFGVVNKVKNTKTHVEYAIKCLRVCNQSPEEEIMKEISFYEKLSSLPNLPRTLIKYFGYCKIKKNNKEEFHILMEYKKSNLALEIEEKRKKKQTFSKQEILDFLDKMLHALTFLQENNIAHRDLKPGNIVCDFVDGKLDFRLIDFGASRITEDFTYTQTVVGTINYMAPELRESALNRESEIRINFFKADVFSLGLILILMIYVDVNLSSYRGLERLNEFVEDYLERLSRDIENDRVLQLFLPQLLEIDPSTRKDFITIKKEYNLIKKKHNDKILAQSILNQGFLVLVTLIYGIFSSLKALNN